MAGHARQRGNGTWELRAYVGRDPITGRKRYATRTVAARGKREADKALAAFVARADAGTARPSAAVQGLVPLGGRLLPVQYVRHDDAKADLPLDRPELWPFYKLWGYRHEREVRLVVPATWDLVEPTDDEGRWGRVLDTDLLSILRSIRVFAPNKSACDELLDRVSNASHGAEVTRTRAYPRLFRRGSDDWWIEGMEPEPDWRQRMMRVSSPIAPEPE